MVDLVEKSKEGTAATHSERAKANRQMHPHSIKSALDLRCAQKHLGSQPALPNLRWDQTTPLHQSQRR